MTTEQERILIVDDEEAIRRLLYQKLLGEGYRGEEAGSAEQALDKLRSNTIELVLLDIKMPGKSGAELLPGIKASYPDTAVIMATAITDTSTAIQCMKEGAYDYLTKPFNLDEVILSVDRALEKRRLELENRDYQQHLEQKVEAQAKKIRASFLNAMTALAYALEAKDIYTSGHSQRVAESAVAIAKEIGMPPDSINKVRLAGLVHDIGKIGVKESVLNKVGKLTDDEFEHIKAHCEIGEHILTPIVEDEEILKAVRHHHERYNGKGYPDGLSGEQIPLGARILAVADAYDAMTSERSYRKAMSDETACTEIERGKGTQFDTEVADAFLRTKKSATSAV
ncbi:MAG TPA: response regulator [Dehalococcoidia bacterium]|nr:response regulator [Dehalococcoidia bacterium]